MYQEKTSSQPGPWICWNHQVALFLHTNKPCHPFIITQAPVFKHRVFLNCQISMVSSAKLIHWESFFALQIFLLYPTCVPRILSYPKCFNPIWIFWKQIPGLWYTVLFVSANMCGLKFNLTMNERINIFYLHLYFRATHDPKINSASSKCLKYKSATYVFINASAAEFVLYPADYCVTLQIKFQKDILEPTMRWI